MVATRTIHAGFYRSTAVALRHGSFRHAAGAERAAEARSASRPGEPAWR
jgi:hypothetical protein